VALGILRRKSFDVVLMDCDMPAMDGLATTRRIRAQARWAGLPIIGLVTGAAAEKRRRCLEAGMDDSLRKPVYSEELLQAVQRWGTRPENEPEAEGREAASDSDTQKPPERVVLDSERALGMLGGDRELFREVLSTFVSSIPETMEAFQEGIADADMQGLKIRAHSLKGTAACVCAEVVRESAQRIENLLEEGKLEEVRKALEVLRSELDELGETAAAVIAEVQQSSAGGPSQSPAP
jgi:HPt (histidine-containing phosphotransfer) domain-containing protein